jgi:hypothetical protein
MRLFGYSFSVWKLKVLNVRDWKEKCYLQQNLLKSELLSKKPLENKFFTYFFLFEISEIKILNCIELCFVTEFDF